MINAFFADIPVKLNRITNDVNGLAVIAFVPGIDVTQSGEEFPIPYFDPALNRRPQRHIDDGQWVLIK